MREMNSTMTPPSGRGCSGTSIARGDLLNPQPTVLRQLRAGIRDAEGNMVQGLAMLLEIVTPMARAIPGRLYQLDHRAGTVDECLLEGHVDRPAVVGAVHPLLGGETRMSLKPIAFHRATA